MNLIRHGVYAVPPSPRCGEGEDRFAIGQRLSSAYSAHTVGVLLPSPHRGEGGPFVYEWGMRFLLTKTPEPFLTSAKRYYA